MQTQSHHPRAIALSVIAQVLDGRRTLDEVLSPAALDAPVHAQVRGLCMATLRHLGQLDALLTPYLQTPLPPKRQLARHALRLGAADLLVQGSAAHAVVHEVVDAVKHSKDSALAGLVNAVLKKLAVEMPALPDCRFNLPGWLEQRWKAQYGKAVSDTICRVAAQRPSLDLNSAQPVMGATQLEPTIWRLPAGHAPVPTLEGYAEGTFFVQDVAASYPVELLGDVACKTVLDIGAAPGGKTAQLARGGAQVTALDKSARRMERLQANMQRLRLDVEVVVADAQDYAPAGPFDIVVLDAPCSATGTWRRHPEVVHTVTFNDIAELAQQQRDLLARAWGWVKPSGVLLYCVCSLEREEGEGQLEWFAAQMPDAIALKQRRTTPAQMEAQGGMDGFFAMTWQKK